MHITRYVAGPFATVGTVSHPGDADLLEDSPYFSTSRLGANIANAQRVGKVMKFASGLRDRLHGLGVRARARPFRSLSAKVKARAEKNDTVFSGTSIAFDGAMTPKNQPWWSRIELSSARVRVALPQELRLHAQVRAKDVMPATALLASISGIPRWLLDAAPFDDLVAHGDVRLGPGIAELRSVSAKGGSQALQFEYKENAKYTEWALMADAGPLRVGVHSSRLGTDVRLLDVESWFVKIRQNMNGATPLR